MISTSHPDPILASARAHHQAGRLGDAETACRQALNHQPRNAAALALLARIAAQTNREELAASLLLSAWEAEPGRVDYLVDWGRLVLPRLGSDTVLSTFQEAARRFPESAELHERLGSLYQMRGQGDDALTCYQRAVELDPDRVHAQANLGILLNQKGRIAETLTACTRAVELQPEDALVQYSLGHARLKTGEVASALGAFRRAVDLAPRWGCAHAAVLESLLQSGDARGAVRAGAHALTVLGYDSGVIAYYYYALLETGDTRAAQALLGTDRLIRQIPVPIPPGRGSAADFNRALADELSAQPHLMWEPLGRTTRGGRQSTNLLEHPTPVLCDFLVVLRQLLDDYIYGPTGPLFAPVDGHPFDRARPTRYGLDIWATFLKAGGYQDPHIHTSGWLSGVYYVQLPRSLGASGNDTSGWIEFGRPPAALSLGVDPPVHTVQPREGLLILFPSYVFHRTIPVADSTERISIAFDLIP